MVSKLIHLHLSHNALQVISSHKSAEAILAEIEMSSSVLHMQVRIHFLLTIL